MSPALAYFWRQVISIKYGGSCMSRRHARGIRKAETLSWVFPTAAGRTTIGKKKIAGKYVWAANEFIRLKTGNVEEAGEAAVQAVFLEKSADRQIRRLRVESERYNISYISEPLSVPLDRSSRMRDRIRIDGEKDTRRIRDTDFKK